LNPQNPPLRSPLETRADGRRGRERKRMINGVPLHTVCWRVYAYWRRINRDKLFVDTLHTRKRVHNMHVSSPFRLRPIPPEDCRRRNIHSIGHV